MGRIRELPAALINQIAAGEVVERPASVVKELLENAIDAGATRLEVSVERGGKDLVRIADNGGGIALEDLPLAFRPHATSKLVEAEDLFRIQTLGFRGEALAAIAEVSRVRCQTRTADAQDGWEVEVEGGVAGEPRPCSGPVGTVFEVRNLFFNTPVRRTFLKSDTTEAGHVAEMVTRVALGHPQVNVVYRSSNRLVQDLPASSGLRERIGAFFGQEVADSLLWVESRVRDVHLCGYVAHPSQSRSSAKGQYLFVKGRYVRDRSLGHALSEAYRGLVMVGRYPMAFLYLDMPPDEVDVNVHPTKIEVRFRDSHQVYSQVLSTVRQTFLASDLHARLQVEPASAALSSGDEMRASAPASFSEHAPFQLDAGTDRRQQVAAWFTPSGPAQGNGVPRGTPPSLPPRPEPAWAQNLPGITRAPAGWDDLPAIPSAGMLPTLGTDLGELAAAAPEADIAPQAISPYPKAIQIHDSYLVVETAEGLLVIDQHALHERILFEEFKERLRRGPVESQRLLMPEPLELTSNEAAALLEHAEVLSRLGLGLEPFGRDTVALTATPNLLRHLAPERLVRDLADHLLSHPAPPTADELLNDVLSLLACKAAVKAGQRLADAEIAALLERRHLAQAAHHCPHGRPTALTFSKADLERQFGRT